MKSSRYKNKPKLIMIFVMIAAFTISVRLLIGMDGYTTALLYIGIPIMFASSIILFEGFICVLMFMPIYLTVILLIFAFKAYFEYAKKKGKGSHGAHILPVLLLFSAFEGVTPELSFSRDEQVVVTRVVQASIDDIRKNLVKPMELQKERPWFLNLFPMPEYINAGTLNQGDVHEINFKYYRWFVTNLHREDVLYSAFIHPLSPLSKDELIDALNQVSRLAITFGSTYSSSELSFGGK